MASMRERFWKTSTGKERSGWEVSWYERKRRRKKTFSGPGAKAQARQLRGHLDSAAPRQRAEVTSAAEKRAPTGTVASAGERGGRYVERELRRERSTRGKYEQRLR